MDRITYEIVRSALYATAREMKVAMMHTAGSPIIHSGGDASAAIFDAQMQLVAQGNDIPTMLGSAVMSTRASVEAVGRHNLRPGDVIVSNDVYLGGGNHQPDVQFTRPVFFAGEIVAFTMTRGHWVDIGGTSPGSFSPVTWDLHAEGIRIPPVFIYRNDAMVEDIARLIVLNTRDPDSRMLDIKAQYSGTYVGDRRLCEIAKKYGAAALADAMRESLDYSERLMRSELRRIPDGVYQGEDWLEPVEGPGWPTDLIPLKVKITKAGDEIEFDFTGSSQQVRGGINCPLPVTYNSTWFTVKAITDPSIPINQGCYRPIRVICPEGTILNCVYPAPVVSGNTETSPRVIDMLLAALAPAVPQRVIAQSHDASCCAIFGGADPDERRVRAMRRRYVSQIDIHPGGMGARPDKDGINAIRVHGGNTGSQSVESIERSTPLTITRWEILPDTGGPGTFRGGCATEREYVVEYGESTLTVIGERERVAPQGLFGGQPGSLFESRVTRPDGTVERMPAKGPYAVVTRGSKVLVRPGGSGGYGVPLDRDPSSVLADVLDGYVSMASARDDYGVVLASDARSVDQAATVALRATKRMAT